MNNLLDAGLMGLSELQLPGVSLNVIVQLYFLLNFKLETYVRLIETQCNKWLSVFVWWNFETLEHGHGRSSQN